jgi:hypothetical protein
VNAMGICLTGLGVASDRRTRFDSDWSCAFESDFFSSLLEGIFLLGAKVRIPFRADGHIWEPFFMDMSQMPQGA